MVRSQASTALVVQGGGVSAGARFHAAYGTGRPVAVSFASVGWIASALNQAGATQGGLTPAGIQACAFDPRRPNDYYFLTTDAGPTTALLGPPPPAGGLLWLLRLADASHPERSATLALVLDGSEAPHLNTPVSLTIDHRGNLLIQDSPGMPGAEPTRILAYRITGDHDVRVEFDAELVTPGSPELIAPDEECSKVVDRSRLDGRPSAVLVGAQLGTEAADPDRAEVDDPRMMRVDACARDAPLSGP